MGTHRTAIILNSLAIYLIWGSTYLAIKYAIADIPPLILAGARFTLAGMILLAIAQWKKEKALDPATRKRAFFSGSLLVMGNALVCVAEVTISSGMAAVIVGSVPIWVMLFNWGVFKGKKPTTRQSLGIISSMVGLIILSRAQGVSYGSFGGILAITIAVISWAFGTLLQSRADLKGRLIRYSGFQLFVGSFTALAFASMAGEFRNFDVQAIGSLAWASYFYMVVFGSAIAFSSYLWLTQNLEPSKVSTYAVVNPIVAVWLGWALLGEPLTVTIILATLLVLAGIYFVVFARKLPAPQAT